MGLGRPQQGTAELNPGKESIAPDSGPEGRPRGRAMVAETQQGHRDLPAARDGSSRTRTAGPAGDLVAWMETTLHVLYSKIQ